MPYGTKCCYPDGNGLCLAPAEFGGFSVGRKFAWFCYKHWLLFKSKNFEGIIQQLNNAYEHRTEQY
jgi:hypothetical protein